MKSSAEYATAIQIDFFEQINMRYGLGMSKSFTSMFSQVPSDVVDELVKGNIYKDGRGLSKRIWWTGNKVNADIDKIIQKGIAEKKSAIELAQDLQTYVNPDAQKDWNWKKVYPGTSKTIDYSAQRLARTSISHAYTLSLLKSCERNPFITKVRWHNLEVKSSQILAPAYDASKDVADVVGDIKELDNISIEQNVSNTAQ
ncbi:hypothetical protein [Clostridium coskatii]|uniref:Uncharacterized protein n=1 Tax=Clostridium coskatii TaxID=1705578 RepID=A0A168MAX5_9CLOT|nr:hypothetical protein [Clostridium coskatii]OAA84459.1 hypothetical protein WX73_03491 [Clostridium coskatii]OBR94089.1 hypothetical protein CLCOS_20550 [Clostridium coskatii]